MVSNCWKQILEAAKLAYANKTGVYHFQEMTTFGKLPIDFPAKVYLLYLLYLIVLNVVVLYLIGPYSFLKSFW